LTQAGTTKQIKPIRPKTEARMISHGSGVCSIRQIKIGVDDHKAVVEETGARLQGLIRGLAATEIAGLLVDGA
jgi:hypothetical protein